jgi:sterol desaturase/sphingolipid hydroxylase (fatty acid hydroxylase superfamily)
MASVWQFVHGFVLWPALALAAFALCFFTIERLWPAVPGQKLWRRGTATDLALSFLNPMVVTPVTSLLVTALVNAVLGAVGYDYLDAAQARVAGWPYWAQISAALLFADFFAYWKHRVFHAPLLWPIHAVHHSADEIDWLTNERDHPLQLLATHLAVVIPLVLAGFSPEVIAVQATLRRAYSLYTHANVRWSYGPLDRIFVSPAFHRWHHAADAEMAGKNFAVFFSFYDVLFGSFRMPGGERQPAAFGLPDRESLPGLAAVLRYPFRGRYRAAA